MIGGILFFVIEMKLGCEGQDSLAQLFLELLCKAEFLLLSYTELIVCSGHGNEQECQI